MPEDDKDIVIVTSIHPDFDSRIWKHASSVARQGHRVTLICPWDVEPGEIREGVQMQPFAAVRSRLARLVQIPYRVGREVWKVRKRARLYHFHDIDLLPWFSLVALFKPVVYDVHENYADEIMVRQWVPDWARRPLRFAVKHGQSLLCRIVRNVVLVTPYQEKDFSGGHINRVYVRNYAAQSLMDGVADDYMQRKDAVIFIGSQHLNNGSELLLDIAELVRARHPGIQFYASDRFGNAEFRAHICAEIERRGLSETVELLPNVLPHKLMSVLNRATIAINPNLRVDQQIKGIHTKMFEFMAAGLPIVTSDLPHQVEVINASQAGLLAQPEDPASFAGHIDTLIGDRDHAAQLGRNGQKAFLELYAWESQIPALIDFYDGILAAA